ALENWTGSLDCQKQQWVPVNGRGIFKLIPEERRFISLLFERRRLLRVLGRCPLDL
ncbi:hypothetical protein FRC12_000559, partial [Ceratobasidium sp. 428]